MAQLTGHRFLYDNVFAGATLTASSVRTGMVTASLKVGTGSATVTPSGDSTYDGDLEYTVEIDSVASGAEVGNATFKWGDGTTAAWTAEGVSTSATVTLNNGISLGMTSGTGADFVLGDIWYFKAINRFATRNLFDWERDTRYRSASGTTSITIVLDLGSAQLIEAVALLDHNLSATATVTIEANTADSWGSPAFSEALTYNATKLLHYLSTAGTYRYWRLVIVDTANTSGYIEIGQLFGGPYFQPQRNMKMGFQRDIVFAITSTTNRYNVTRKRFHNMQQTFKGVIENMPLSDRTGFITLVEALVNKEDETIQPLIFHVDYDSATDFYLMEWEDLRERHTFRDGTNSYHAIDVQLVEVARTLGA